MDYQFSASYRFPLMLCRMVLHQVFCNCFLQNLPNSISYHCFLRSTFASFSNSYHHINFIPTFFVTDLHQKSSAVLPFIALNMNSRMSYVLAVLSFQTLPVLYNILVLYSVLEECASYLPLGI